MKFRLLALSGAVLFAGVGALAQGLRADKPLGPQAAAAKGFGMAASDNSPSPAQQSADFIVAVVNAEPITNHQVTVEVRRILQQYEQQNKPAPNLRELTRQVLDRLINERVQLQLARENGIKIDEPSIDQAEESVARQNQMDLAELRRRVALEGVEPKQFRDQLRDQLLLTRLREREVDPRVRVSDLEVDQFLKEETEKSSNPANQLLNMAQVLIAVSDDASPEQVNALLMKAQAVATQARAGGDFAALVEANSNAKDKGSGGEFGLRPADKYPPLFLEATQNLAPGEVSEPVRSGAGFHIIKLIDKRMAGLPPMTVTQSHARHILLIPSAQITEQTARDMLNDFRRRIVSGQADFATLARENSQDGSAGGGGDLGWANPGQFVPEFEEVLNRLAPLQISQPLISRFGVHLIQLLERRTARLSEREQRDMIRSMLREKRYAEVFASWMQDVRARAYVELRDAPV